MLLNVHVEKRDDKTNQMREASKHKKDRAGGARARAEREER